MYLKGIWRGLSRLTEIAAIAILATGAGQGMAQQSVPVVTGDARVDKLLSQMTLEEKLSLIHGAQEDPSVNQGQNSWAAYGRRTSRSSYAASFAGRNGHHGRGCHVQRERR